MKKDRLHQIWDIGSVLTIISLICTLIWQDGRDSSWKDNFTHEVNLRFNFFEEKLIQLNEKLDKVQNILMTRK